MMKPMMNKKATMKPMIKKEIGMAMMPTKIKNKNGMAMKPKTMQKIHANMGNAYSLLVQKAAGGVTCADIGTTATQIRAYHSRHQTEVGDGTVGVAEANRGRKNLTTICLQQVDLKHYILGLGVAL